MTKQQYKQLKQAVRHKADVNPFGVGCLHDGDYIVSYSPCGGYDVCNRATITMPDNCFRFISACRKLAQLEPGTSGEQLADARAFLEVYKK